VTLCECLAKHMYDKSGGNVYSKSTAVDGTDWAGADAVATAASTGRLFITEIRVFLGAAGVVMDFGVAADSDTFEGVTQTTAILGPITMDFSAAPFVLEAGTSLKAYVSAGTSYVAVRGYQMP